MPASRARAETIRNVGNRIVRANSRTESDQMRTTIREGPYISALRGRRLENRNTDFSAFRHIDQRKRAAPDVEKTVHRHENALTAQGLNRRSTTDGEAASGNGGLPERTSEHRFK